MAAFAYLLLPITGLIAYFSGGARARLHGFQAIVLGVLWPLLLYLCSIAGATATQIAFLIGALVWLTFLIGTASGRDPKLPFVWAWLRDRREP